MYSPRDQQCDERQVEDMRPVVTRVQVKLPVNLSTVHKPDVEYVVSQASEHIIVNPDLINFQKPQNTCWFVPKAAGVA